MITPRADANIAQGASLPNITASVVNQGTFLRNDHDNHA